MAKTTRRSAALVAAAAAVAALASPTAAHAAAPHYYIEIGGTGSAADAPACTVTYSPIDQLNGGIAVPVCYPASLFPFVGSHNEQPAPLGTPDFDDSANQGYHNMLNVTEATYHQHPDARITITGYSQGAQVADDVLQTIANGGTDIPKSQVDGMLYSDPQQPGTGLWAMIPKGISFLGATSPGPGPVEFSGIPVQRFCIHTDGVCDATSLESLGGFIVQHPRYPSQFIPQTLGNDGTDGVTWYPQT
jgi:PE-PPE domain